MKLNKISSQRRLAKNGLIISLGITTLSGLMMKGKSARYLHYTAGAALIGLTIWHHQLYPPTRPASTQFPPKAVTQKIADSLL